MSRRLVNITLDNLGDLPPSCRSCVFWELDPISKARAEASDPGLEKESWISSVLLEWGSCGKLLYVDGVPAAYVLFAPPQYVPRSVAFPTSPVSADAVLLMTARVLSEFSGGGLGRMLIQGMAKDLTRRGVRAIEAFGDKQWTAPACVLPVDYLLAVGFKTVRPHHRHPRLRMELRSTLSWREDVEVALERLLGSMTPERVLRPAPAPAVVSGRARTYWVAMTTQRPNSASASSLPSTVTRLGSPGVSRFQDQRSTSVGVPLTVTSACRVLAGCSAGPPSTAKRPGEVLTSQVTLGRSAVAVGLDLVRCARGSPSGPR